MAPCASARSIKILDRNVILAGGGDIHHDIKGTQSRHSRSTALQGDCAITSTRGARWFTVRSRYSWQRRLVQSGIRAHVPFVRHSRMAVEPCTSSSNRSTAIKKYVIMILDSINEEVALGFAPLIGVFGCRIANAFNHR